MLALIIARTNNREDIVEVITQEVRQQVRSSGWKKYDGINESQLNSRDEEQSFPENDNLVKKTGLKLFFQFFNNHSGTFANIIRWNASVITPL